MVTSRPGFDVRFWCLLVFLAAVFIAPGFAQEYLKNNDMIRVVCDDTYPPYSFRDSKGIIQGIIPDQWRLWSKVTGREVDFKAMDWESCLSVMASGGADVLDSVFKTEEREKIYEFLPPYATIDVPVFFHQSISGIAQVSDLKGFRIAVKSGDNCIDILKAQGITELVEYPSYEMIIDAADRFDIRVFCVDKPPALYFLYKAGLDREFKTTFSLYSGQFHRAVRKDRRLLSDGSDLYAVLKTGFAAITPEQYRAIDRTWYGRSLSGPIDLSWVLWIGVSILIIVVVLAIFIIALRLRVQTRTRELKNMIAELETSERKNRAFIAALPDLILIMDREGRYYECKTAVPDLLFLPEEQLIGRTMAEIGIAPEVAGLQVAAIARAMSGTGVATCEYELTVPAGNVRFEARVVRLDEEKAMLIARDITERAIAEKKTEKSLREKEILLKEVHHRVKNNMQVVSSLVSLQGNLLKNEEDREMFKETQARIKAMAQIHELLYRSSDLSSINMSDYLNSLVHELIISYMVVSGTAVHGVVDVDAFDCPIDTAVPLGLLVNELVSNAMKYAFRAGTGNRIWVSIKPHGKELTLVVEDDGSGLPPDYEERARDRLGLTLVAMLAEQAHGRLTLSSDPAVLRSPSGTRAEVIF